MNRVKYVAFAAMVFVLVLGQGVLFAQNGRGPRQKRAEIKEKIEDDAKLTKKLEKYLSDQGFGKQEWKEYTVNPEAKGEPSMLVIFGGQKSVKRQGPGNKPITPAALERAVNYAKSTKEKTIILVPQLVVGWKMPDGREMAAVTGISNLVRERAMAKGVKPNRVFATGFSMGGHLLWTLLDTDPALFARALVVGASGNLEKTGHIRADVRVLHGAEDTSIELAKVQAFVSAVNSKRPNTATLTVLKGKDHSASEESAYSSSEQWRWLLKP